MQKIKLTGVLFMLLGFIILFYKRSGFYGWGGYVDKTWENILISSVLIIIGIILIKRAVNN